VAEILDESVRPAIRGSGRSGVGVGAVVRVVVGAIVRRLRGNVGTVIARVAGGGGETLIAIGFQEVRFESRHCLCGGVFVTPFGAWSGEETGCIDDVVADSND